MLKFFNKNKKNIVVVCLLGVIVVFLGKARLEVEALSKEKVKLEETVSSLEEENKELESLKDTVTSLGEEISNLKESVEELESNLPK